MPLVCSTKGEASGKWWIITINKMINKFGNFTKTSWGFILR